VATLKRRPNLTVRDLGSEMIVYDDTFETYHVLNATARQIWLWLEEDGIAQKLASQFPHVDQNRIQEDVDRTIQELGRIGLVER
jgi:hypothetical protein